MGIFDNVHEVKTYDNIPSLKPGNYRLRLEKLEVGNTQRQQKEFVRAKVVVVKASGEGSTSEGTLAEIFFTPHPKFPEYAKKDTANMTKAFLGGQVTKEAWDEIKKDAETMKGQEADVEIRQVVKNGTPKIYASGDPILEYRWMTSSIPSAAVVASQGTSSTASKSK